MKVDKRSWGDLTATEKQHLADLFDQNKPLPYDQFKMAPASVKRKVSEVSRIRRELVVAKAMDIQLVEKPRKLYTDFFVLDGDDWLIISDIEVPDHDVAYLRLALITAMNRGIRKCIIAGDLIASDQAALTSWMSTWSADGVATYKQSVNEVKAILNEYSKWFDEIYIIEGNHDDRVARKTGGEVFLGMFLEDCVHVRYSRYAYLYLQTSRRGKIKVVHPSNFSQDPVTLGEKLYNVEQGPHFNAYDPINTFEKTHIVLAHCHRNQRGKSPDGVFEVHALGTGRNEEATQYKRKGATKHYQWDHHFLVVDNGYFYGFDIATTDWQRELGDLYPTDLFEELVVLPAA